MYCSRCGSLVSSQDKFCNGCGAPVSVPATIAPPTVAPAPSFARPSTFIPPPISAAPAAQGPGVDRLWKVRIWVGVICFVAGILLVSNLQPIAGWIGIVALLLFAFVWSIPSIQFRQKIGFVVLSVVLIVGVQWFETYGVNQQTEDRQRHFGGITAQNEAAARLKAQQDEDAFKNLAPAQHLAAAKDDMRVGASADQIAEGKRHLQALQGTPLEGQGAALESRYETSEAKAEKAQAASAAAAAAKEAKEAAVADETLRQDYAKTLENNLLGEGFDVDVNAIGSQHTTLRVKWVLATKVDAFQLTNGDQSMFNEARAIGFKKFVIWDGYDESWTWTLNK